jgi:hypothetical protein
MTTNPDVLRLMSATIAAALIQTGRRGDTVAQLAVSTATEIDNAVTQLEAAPVDPTTITPPNTPGPPNAPIVAIPTDPPSASSTTGGSTGPTDPTGTGNTATAA